MPACDSFLKKVASRCIREEVMKMFHGMGYVLGDATESAGWREMTGLMREMMGPYRTGGGYVFWQLHWIFDLVTWVLIIAFLVALVRWMWKKGDKK